MTGELLESAAMGRSISPFDRAGLVIGLCPNTQVYTRLVTVASERGLSGSTVRAACTAETERALASFAVRAASHPWDFNRLENLDEKTLQDDGPEDTLLRACFRTLANMPGSCGLRKGCEKTTSAIGQVIAALDQGGIILVVESYSLDEQRDWARTLLRSGCALVQTHDSIAGGARDTTLGD